MRRSLTSLGRAVVLVAALSACAEGLHREPAITRGPGVLDISDLMRCPQVPGSRRSALGRVTSQDGSDWVTPAAIRWPGRPLPDLYNACADIEPKSLSDVDLAAVDVIEVDPDGEIITGYIFADNYFELYVNGVYVGSDPVIFTPFNTVVVRFRARRPVHYAVKLVDWEENLGLGTEATAEGGSHAGDGGFIASFSDGTVTDDGWRVQSLYIAPLERPDDLRVDGVIHQTPARFRSYPDAPSQSVCGQSCYAARFTEPDDWQAVDFDDSRWPLASLYTETEMGAGQPAYVNFRPQLTAGGARIIWSSSLVLDNVVIARKTGQ